ncbi:MAG: extracellular solute-binding protein [Candidatus Schekmanbacteria bacterium]|nr:extracellular solute-binding protein [Candidatus Schekmanbacteria bacterium]
MTQRRWVWRGAIAALAIFGGTYLTGDAAAKDTLVLWHAYRGEERAALESVIATFNAGSASAHVDLLAIPYDAFADKITAAVPRGKGPDLFIFAHDRIGGWAESKLIEPIEFWVNDERRSQYFPITLQALTYRDSLYGLPMAFKSTALYYNKALVSTPPKTTDELVEQAKKLTDVKAGRFGLVYENANFYYHSCWFQGFGGTVFDNAGRPALDSAEQVRALAFARDLDRKHGIIPQEVTNVLVTTLFNQGNGAMVISGPWFRGEIAGKVDYGVAPLPEISGLGRRATPFMSSEAVIMSAHSTHKEAAYAVMEYLTSADAARVMATKGRQTAANVKVWEQPDVAKDPTLSVFRAQLDDSRPMPNTPEMTMVWTPASTAMAKVIVGTTEPGAALKEAQQEVEKLIEGAKR